MAIAVNGGHVSRALDFYRTAGKYFIVGGTTAWDDETNPSPPSIKDFKLRNVVGLKKVDNTYMVIPHEEGTIQFRDQNWKIVPDNIETIITEKKITAGERVFSVASVAGLTEGSKIRVNNVYEGTIVSITGVQITLDTAAPEDVPLGSTVLGGALVEGARYVYVDCYLNYDEFPIVTYRQIGLCTGVTPNTVDVMRSAEYAIGGTAEYTSLGVLEVLDNRVPATRDANQRELLSLIIEF